MLYSIRFPEWKKHFLQNPPTGALKLFEELNWYSNKLERSYLADILHWSNFMDEDKSLIAEWSKIRCLPF